MWNSLLQKKLFLSFSEFLLRTRSRIKCAIEHNKYIRGHLPPRATAPCWAPSYFMAVLAETLCWIIIWIRLESLYVISPSWSGLGGWAMWPAPPTCSPPSTAQVIIIMIMIMIIMTIIMIVINNFPVNFYIYFLKHRHHLNCQRRDRSNVVDLPTLWTSTGHPHTVSVELETKAIRRFTKISQSRRRPLLDTMLNMRWPHGKQTWNRDADD